MFKCKQQWHNLFLYVVYYYVMMVVMVMHLRPLKIYLLFFIKNMHSCYSPWYLILCKIEREFHHRKTKLPFNRLTSKGVLRNQGKSPPMRKPFRQNNIQWDTTTLNRKPRVFHIHSEDSSTSNTHTCMYIQEEEKDFGYIKRWEKIHRCWMMAALSRHFTKKVNFWWTENETKEFRLANAR